MTPAPDTATSRRPSSALQRLTTAVLERAGRDRLIAALVAVALLGGVAPLQAQTQADVDEARAERDQVRSEADAVAGRIDALGDEADELGRKLDVLAITINAAESRLEVAATTAAATRADLEAVEADIAELQRVKADLEQVVVDTAVTEYIGGTKQAQATVLSSDDPVRWSLRQGLYSFVVTDITSLQDQLRVIDAQLTAAQADAQALAQQAADEEQAVEAIAREASAARATHADVLGQVRVRMDRRLAEAESLAAIDEQLSEEIRAGEAEIARRVALAEELERQRRAEAGETDSGTDNGTPEGPSGSDIIARPEDIVSVRGIEVHFSIASNLENLLGQAEADGIILAGTGWRSTERQIELRMQNCGTTDYLIFDAPAEACFPPTARPATSNHEAGLAVDFTANGFAVIDRNSSGFLWLAANAPRYGFYNLWSEPWHWSVDGR